MEYSGKLRRNLFGGFRRKDVLACIEELNEKYTDETVGLQRQLNEAQAALKEQKEAFEQAQKQAEELTNAREKLSAQCQELLEQNGALTKKNESLQAQVQATISVNDGKIREINALKEENRQLQFKAESLEFKGKKYDQFAGEFSELLLRSKQQSEQLLEEAKAQADSVIEDANQKAQTIMSGGRQAVSGLDRQLSDLSGELQKMKQSILAITRQTQQKLDALSEVVAQSRKALDGAEELDGQNADPFFDEPQVPSRGGSGQTQPEKPKVSEQGNTPDRETMMNTIFEKLRKWFE